MINLKEKAGQLNKDIPAIFLALKKKETPWYARFLALLTVSYALSPVDLIPDFIPVLGYLDDLMILPLLTALTIKLIPKDVLAQCRMESAQLWNKGKPKKWYYALPTVFFWLIIIALIIKAII